MFDDHNGCTVFHKGLEYLKKRLYIQRMKTDGRLIKDKQRVILQLAHFTGQFQTLGLTTGKAWGFFS